MPENRVGDILEERAKVHGDFKLQATISQELKTTVRHAGRPLCSTQREAVEMILHKIARIVAGSPFHRDHWDDIAGYATLVSNEIGAKDEED